MKDLSSMFRGNWYVSSTPLSENDSPLITDISSQAYNELIANLISSSHIKKAVFVYNAPPFGGDLRFG